MVDSVRTKKLETGIKSIRVRKPRKSRQELGEEADVLEKQRMLIINNEKKRVAASLLNDKGKSKLAERVFGNGNETIAAIRIVDVLKVGVGKRGNNNVEGLNVELSEKAKGKRRKIDDEDEDEPVKTKIKRSVKENVKILAYKGEYQINIVNQNKIEICFCFVCCFFPQICWFY